MKRFLLSELPDESKRSSNIVRGDVILALDFLERHAPSQAPHRERFELPASWFVARFLRVTKTFARQALTGNELGY
jgi:hypothetical protein